MIFQGFRLFHILSPILYSKAMINPRKKQVKHLLL